MNDQRADVAIIMGSQSDWATMRQAAETLEALGVPHKRLIISAHRTPDRLYEFAKGAKAAGYKVIIAGAGGAAHLPGMTAAMTPLPVFGSAWGGQMREHIALMRSLGYRYTANEKILQRFDRFEVA